MPYLATFRLSEPRSEIRECGGLRSSERSEETLFCPKPRRVAVTNLRSVDSIKSIRQLRSISSTAIEGTDPGCEIAEIFASKCSYGNFGCSPPYFTGSPPSRSANPLVRDTHFLHPHVYSSAEVASPAKEGSAVTSIQANPCVRVEGFDCSVRRFECTGRDAARRIPAFA